MITQKKKNSLKKKDQIKQKILAESSTEREEHGITTEEKSETAIPQPVLVHTHTDEVRNSASRSNLVRRMAKRYHFEGSETIK